MPPPITARPSIQDQGLREYVPGHHAQPPECFDGRDAIARGGTGGDLGNRRRLRSAIVRDPDAIA
jgi:hypothetical protein